MVESLGTIVRLGWTGVAGATQYRIIILNTDGRLIDFIDYFIFHLDFLVKNNYG